ncbi:hypothetical protein H0H93_011588 [Arthromyces matolae]|nr:hypothetical protein H0H93_011588 [Arthromyces matolae]
MASALTPDIEQDSEDDFDWEEVPVPDHQQEEEPQQQHLEITIPGAGPRSKKSTTPSKAVFIGLRNRFKGIPHEERLRRIDCHKLHTVVLLANAWYRNKWLNDPLLQARLLSLTPLSLQNAFGMIHKSRVADQGLRGRMFEAAIVNLVEWWSQTHFEVIPSGHLKNRTFDDVQARLEKLGPPPTDPDAVLDIEDVEDIMGEEPERIRSEKSLMKHALMGSGSRDVSAQLFTALCRGLGIPARLVASIQSVPWQTHVGKPKPTTTPPVFWTEVFSRPDGRWIPVDPIRSLVNKRKVFDPTPTSAAPAVTHSPLFPQAYAEALDRRAIIKNASRAAQQENRMVYVLAFEEDGFARDVTRRYAKEYSAKVAKVQGGSNTIGGGGKARQAWWEAVMSIVSRPYRLNRDDIEDEELDAAQMTEGMPSTVSGFKDHPIYALARHLKQNQVIHPPDTPEIGKFRGEGVYPRSAVVSLKTAENWMRSEGRMVREGSQPLKMVKIRAGTINRMRELEVMKDELRSAGDQDTAIGESMQGLYARSQTEPYKPDPVVDGKVPKNNFGNIDLYVPSMLPRGAVHVPYLMTVKGVAKIAKKLGFDFAEAVTGFEFKKRRAFPVIEGVVIAQENEAALLEAYWEAEQDAEEKARTKREERVLKQWTRLIQGLLIRQRLQTQYAAKPDKESRSHVQDDSHNVAHDGEPGTSKVRLFCLLVTHSSN